MAGKPNQETGFNSPRRCLTSRGRQDIVYPPSLQHLGMSMVHDRHEIRPPERNITVREGVSGPTFDFPSLSSGFVSTDFASFSAPPSVQNQLVGLPPTRTNHEIAENRYRNDSSPHLDDEHGNPTAHATSTTTLEQQQKYSRPMKYRHPDKADELVRNLTYEDWPPNHGPPVELLVRANMFYQGEFVEAGETVRDQVVCYKCGQCFRQWAPTDNPIEEHKRINMECFDTKWLEEL